MTFIAKPKVHHPSLPRNELELTRRDYEGALSTLCAGCGHADDFLRTQVCRKKRQAGHPRGNGASGEEEVRAGLHAALEHPSDPNHKREISD